jgi:ribonucleoside-diphosphate reductase beta chain
VVTEVRGITDDLLEERVSGAQLKALGSMYIDDILAYTDRGLENLPSYLDLYRRSVKQQWSPDELDFSRDWEEWQSLSPETRKRRLWSMRLFFDGEERVASILAPFVWAAPNKEVEAFAATQLADEVRHTIFFERYWREVIGTSAADLDELVEEIRLRENEAYDYFFYRWLPETAQRLASNPKDLETTVEFVTGYHLVVEGALFLTGMRYQLEGARRWGRTWGYYQGFTAATRDESRHVLFGVRYLRDMVRLDPVRFAPVIHTTIRKCLPLISKTMEPPRGEMSYFGGEHLETAWPGYTPQGLRDEMIAEAKKGLARRLHSVGVQVAI